MKKIVYWGICLIVIAAGCKVKKGTDAALVGDAKQDTAEVANYFPVTNYIKGQLVDIKNMFVTPLKFTIKGDKKDSAWLKEGEMEKAISPFLQPVIDTMNMAGLFKEQKFLDKTIGVFTFTYEPIGKLPDSMQLQHWDVYINPKTGKVKRVYLLKNTGPGRQQQLTWQADEKWCKILDIATKPDGTFFVESEQKITWNF